MALSTNAMKNALATAYGVEAATARLYTTVPGASAGTEVTGGSYAPQSLSWSTPTAGEITATVTFDVPAGTTIVGAGVHDDGGAYLDGGSVPSQEFATAGTYELVLTYAQS